MANSPRSWLSFGKGFSVSSAGSPLPSPVSRSVASRQSSETASPTSPPGLSVFKSLGSPGSPVGVVGGVEKDTDDLFCSHTVLEIKKIEQQTRLDIDRRKEDLRQMVGERYRDLIDAADSIVDMKRCSELMLGSVLNMEQVCQHLQQTHFLRGSGGMRGPPKKNKSHEAAAMVRLLAEAPEMIWQCLEGQAYLKATQYFLLSRHVFSQLELSGSSSDVVKKLWHSVSSFKETIMECCSCHLQCSDLEEGPMVQSLCAMMLLEGCSPRQAFAKFLVARKTAIQSVFQTTSAGEGSHRSVKARICQLARSLLHSLTHVSAIFCQHKTVDGSLGDSLLLQKLAQFTSKDKRRDLNQDLIPQGLTHRLPQSVLEFVPSLRSTVVTEIPAGDIHSSTDDWVAMCQTDISNGVSQLLQHVTSVKALSSIRASVHSLLTNPTDSNGNPSPSDEEQHSSNGSDSGRWRDRWTEICQSVLGRDLCLWDTFLRPLLFQRAKVIIEKQSTAASQHATSQLNQLLDNMTSNPALFQADTHCHTHLWREEGAGGRKGGGIEGIASGINTLSLKAKACTPSVYNFCQTLGLDLDSLIDDVSHYLHQQQPSLIISSSRSKDSFPFPLHGDTAALQDYLQETAAHCVSRFLQTVDQKVTDMKEVISSKQQRQPQEVIDRLLLVGRICHSLLESCPSLAQLTVGCKREEEVSHSGFGRFTSNARSRLHSKKEVDTKKAVIADMLQQRTLTVYRIWAQWCSSEFSEQFRSQLSAELELNSLTSTLAWEEITISEESESGTQVSSVIRVPAQTSVYVTSLLFAVCQEISRIGGQALDQSVLAELSGHMMQGVVQHYESLLSRHRPETTTMLSDYDDVRGIPQQCALQLLFNLNFLTNVLIVQEGELADRVKRLVEQLQSCVDPFDLDVFSPYIRSNLHRQLQRSSVLLGMLLAVRNSLTLSKPQPMISSTTGQHQEKHVVLPLTPAIGRLPALPLSSRQSHPTPGKQQQVPTSPMERTGSFSLLQTVTFFHHL